MAEEVLFEPEETEGFNLFTEDGQEKGSITYPEIKWNQNQLALLGALKKIRQNMWIQIYDVYQNQQGAVTGLGFRLSPEMSFYHEYPTIDFDQAGWILNDVQAELKYYQNFNPQGYELVKKFYQVLTKFQQKNPK